LAGLLAANAWIEFELDDIAALGNARVPLPDRATNRILSVHLGMDPFRGDLS
jgi:hypothetical protein